MLRRLLEDRFALRVRRGTEERRMYALVMARGDRQPGPQLRPAAMPCASPDGRCGFRHVDGLLSGRSNTIGRLAGERGGVTSRRIIDRTGLSGEFDIDLQWSPGLSTDTAAAQNEADASLFAALQEQFGLELEPTRGQVDVMVVESVQRPTPN